MSQRDGFAAGFLLGSVFGGIVGGVLGAVLTSRINKETDEATSNAILDETPLEVKPERTKKRQLESSPEQKIEMTRRSLEEKIAQLNQIIDEARQQMGNVNGNTVMGSSERSLSKDA
jgi:Na+/glutamate symporter